MTPRLAALLILLAAVTAAAQTPVRDQPRFISTGSASVTGTVVSDDGATPLRRATVNLARAGAEDSRAVATDDSGQFVFERLPAATYTLSASKGAYITMSYGAAKPGMPGSSIVVTDGQTFAAKPLALMRGGVIAGRLTDQAGRPISSVQVRADQFVTVNGERRRRTTAGAGGPSRTNAHGDFRIYGLLPGEYVVYAMPSALPIQDEVTSDELAWANQRSGATPPAPRSFALAPTMFPGTTDLASGVVITLGRAEERTGVDFAVRSVPVSRVTGTVMALDGRPAANAVVLCSVKNTGGLVPPSGQLVSAAGPDGAFTCFGLAPGAYTLAARIPQFASDAAARAGLPPSGALPPRWAIADVTVAGRDIANVVIQEQPGLSVSGQTLFKTNGAVPSLDPTRVQLRVVPVTPMPVAGASGIVRADGTFQIDGIVPGSYRIVPALPPAADPAVPWTMRSAMLGGKDVADVPFDVVQDTSGLVVTFSNVQTDLTGTLTDAAGTPAPQLYVFVFPTEKTMWFPGSRRVQFARSAENGAYRIAGLPPGDYFLCALTELETTLQTEPSYLEQFVPSSIKITLGEGEKKTQSLRIGG